MWDLAWLESLSTWKHNNLKFKNLKLEKLKLELRSESAAWWGLEPQVGAPGWCRRLEMRGWQVAWVLAGWQAGRQAGIQAGRLAGWQAGRLADRQASKGGPLEADARPLQGCWTGSRTLGFSMTHTVLSRLFRTTCPFPDLPFLRTGLYLGFLLTLQRSCQYLPPTSCQSCKNEPLENLVGLNFFWIPPTVRIRNCCSLLVCRSLVLVLPFPYCWPPAGLEECWSWF